MGLAFMKSQLFSAGFCSTLAHHIPFIHLSLPRDPSGPGCLSSSWRPGNGDNYKWIGSLGWDVPANFPRHCRLAEVCSRVSSHTPSLPNAQIYTTILSQTWGAMSRRSYTKEMKNLCKTVKHSWVATFLWRGDSSQSRLMLTWLFSHRNKGCACECACECDLVDYFKHHQLFDASPHTTTNTDN